jgi:hypothetical protein
VFRRAHRGAELRGVVKGWNLPYPGVQSAMFAPSPSIWTMTSGTRMIGERAVNER